MSGSGEHYSFGKTPEKNTGHAGTANGFQEASSEFILDENAVAKGYPANLSGGEQSFCFIDDRQAARTTFTAVQVLIFATVLGLAIGLLAWWKEAGIIAGSVIFSGFYLCVVVFRAAVLAEYDHPKPALIADQLPPPGKSYVILAALYKEASQVEGLVRSLDRLHWEAHLKRIYLICEEGDEETINAILALRRRDIGLFIVPEGQPRTKPRALNFALQRVSGDFLVLYDAEDRPHPDQLLEAAARFANGPDNVSCLQSPLTIDNRHESLLTRFFAVEYDTLFLGILPALARWKAPIPLGGTSNHFSGVR